MKFRTEPQQYADVPAIVAEASLSNTKNDKIIVEDINRDFNWIEGATNTHDGKFVIDQTSETANGRWIASTSSNTYTGNGLTDALSNGQQSVIQITVAGVLLANSANLVAYVSNYSTFPAGVKPTSVVVIADDTVEVTVDNQSGNDIAAFTVNVAVKEF